MGSADYTESAEQLTRISGEIRAMRTLILTKADVEEVATMEREGHEGERPRAR
jgi:hypothetical protein